MEQQIVVIGCDVGLAATGFCVLTIPRTTLFSISELEVGAAAHVSAAGVISSKPDNHAGTKKSYDYARRVRETLLVLKQMHDTYAVASFETIWTSETFTIFGRQLNAASIETKSLYGGVIGLSTALGERFIPVHPHEGKRVTMGGKKTASKEEVYAVAEARLKAAAVEHYDWPASKNEHAADAFATGVAALVQYARLTR